MFLRNCLLFLCFLVYFVTRAQQSVGARNLAIGTASVSLGDEWSYFSNPAATIEVKKFKVATSYTNQYLLQELQQQGAVVCIPMKKGLFSFGAQVAGQTLAKTTKIGIGYALKLAEGLALGVNLNYHQFRIQNYANTSSLVADAGIYYKINPSVTWGCGVLGVSDHKTSIQQEIFPIALRTGVNIQAANWLNCLVEVEHNTALNFRIKGGVEYTPLSNLKLRLGSIVNEQTIAFGIGYCLKKQVYLDLGSTWQQVLGWSPNVGLAYQFNKTTNE